MEKESQEIQVPEFRSDFAAKLCHRRRLGVLSFFYSRAFSLVSLWLLTSLDLMVRAQPSSLKIKMKALIVFFRTR